MTDDDIKDPLISITSYLALRYSNVEAVCMVKYFDSHYGVGPHIEFTLRRPEPWAKRVPVADLLPGVAALFQIGPFP